MRQVMTTSINCSRATHLLTALALVAMLASCITTTTSTTRDGFVTQASKEQALDDYIELAFAYYNANDMAGARRHIRNALNLNRRSSEAHHIMALVHEREGDDTQAERSFRRAVSMDGGNSRARNNYGAFLFAQQRFTDAYRQLEIVTEDIHYEGRAVAFENLGRSALSLERPAAAEAAFQRALTLNPGLYVSLLELARLHSERQDWPAARDYFQRYAAVLQTYSLPHTPQALLTGIRIENQFANRELAQAYALILETLYQDSPEYQQCPNIETFNC